MSTFQTVTNKTDQWIIYTVFKWYMKPFFFTTFGKNPFPPKYKQRQHWRKANTIIKFIYLFSRSTFEVGFIHIYIYSSAAICQHFHEIPVKLLQLVFWTIINSDCFSFSLCFNKLPMFYVSFHFKGVFYVFFQKIFRLLDWIGLNLVEEKNE